MYKMLSKPLKGIIVPMVTPLLDRNTLDHAGIEKLVEHTISGGVHGLFILGTTGEAPSLSYAQRTDLICRVCKQAAGRVPVLVGITDTSFIESVNMAQAAFKYGAKALVLAPPYYFPAGQPELLEYLEHLLPELHLPLFLYNMPAMTKIDFAPETVIAASSFDGVAGFKDSSGNLIYFKNLLLSLKDKPNFSMFIGPEELLAESVLAGGHGGVNGGANIFPRLYVNLYEAAVEKDTQTITALQNRVMEVSKNLYGVGRHKSSYLKGVKCALSCLGICSDFLAEPFHKFREPERQKIAMYINSCRDLVF
jgi:dihydrodipicolinate synthase/N-acetylneuraminate lyase